jgi:hypothetical protein
VVRKAENPVVGKTGTKGPGEQGNKRTREQKNGDQGNKRTEKRGPREQGSEKAAESAELAGLAVLGKKPTVGFRRLRTSGLREQKSGKQSSGFSSRLSALGAETAALLAPSLACFLVPLVLGLIME